VVAVARRFCVRQRPRRWALLARGFVFANAEGVRQLQPIRVASTLGHSNRVNANAESVG